MMLIALLTGHPADARYKNLIRHLGVKKNVKEKKQEKNNTNRTAQD